MNKKSFETIILNLQLAHKKSRELYKLGVDLMEYDESYEFVIDELFKASFNEDQRGWIDWFLYERESPTGKILKAHKKVGRKKVEICHTIDSLWETVNEAGQDQAFNDRVGE
jgi:fatty acid/phospholipid biosynthesis enzyme